MSENNELAQRIAELMDYHTECNERAKELYQQMVEVQKLAAQAKQEALPYGEQLAAKIFKPYETGVIIVGPYAVQVIDSEGGPTILIDKPTILEVKRNVQA